MAKPSSRTDEEKLRHFYSVVEACYSSTAVTSGTLRSSFTLTADFDGPMQMTVDSGDADHVRSLALDVRKLLAPGDDAYFYSICKGPPLARG